MLYRPVLMAATKASARDQNAKNMPPDFLDFGQEIFIILYMPQLVRVLLVVFKIPIWRRRNYKMYRLIIQKGQFPRIAIN